MNIIKFKCDSFTWCWWHLKCLLIAKLHSILLSLEAQTSFWQQQWLILVIQETSQLQGTIQTNSTQLSQLHSLLYEKALHVWWLGSGRTRQLLLLNSERSSCNCKLPPQPTSGWRCMSQHSTMAMKSSWLSTPKAQFSSTNWSNPA